MPSRDPLRRANCWQRLTGAWRRRVPRVAGRSRVSRFIDPGGPRSPLGTTFAKIGNMTDEPSASEPPASDTPPPAEAPSRVPEAFAIPSGEYRELRRSDIHSEAGEVEIPSP